MQLRLHVSILVVFAHLTLGAIRNFASDSSLDSVRTSLALNNITPSVIGDFQPKGLLTLNYGSQARKATMGADLTVAGES